MTSYPSDFPIENLGPPGTKRELRILPIKANEQRRDEDRLNDRRERQFKVFGRLSKTPPAAEDINGAFGAEDGNSYLLLPDNPALNRFSCSAGMLEIKMNKLGEKSLVEFECIATSSTGAKKKFQSAVLPFLDYLSYLANCPVVVAMLRVEDLENDCICIEYVSPYGTQQFVHKVPRSFSSLNWPLCTLCIAKQKTHSAIFISFSATTRSSKGY